MHIYFIILYETEINIRKEHYRGSTAPASCGRPGVRQDDDKK